MNCSEVQPLIDAYIDGELDLVTSVAIERHLKDCPNCIPIYKNRRVLVSAVRTGPLTFAPPPQLYAQIRTSVRQANGTTAISPLAFLPWRRLSVAAVFIVGVLLTAGVLTGALKTPGSTELLAQEAISSHIRSLMADHLSDVISTDKHTVKPWFDGKLDFSPVVVDLAAQGYPLQGGRLDYLANQPVAALVYRRQQHVINLFTWPTPNAPDTKAKTFTSQGYNVIYWAQSKMSYWVVSDLNFEELQTFVQLFQSQASTTAPAP